MSKPESAGPSEKSSTCRPKLTPILTPEGWGLDAREFTPDVPIWGGNLTKREAVEMKRSYLRNGLYEGSDNG